MALIQGLQKLTLLDYPGKMACTLFTGGCNFRCPFCHNGDLVLSPSTTSSIQTDEVLSFLKKRQSILDGVCISGGEPLLHPETKELIKQIKELGYLVKLDTNGSFPQRLQTYVSEGLIDYVAMDLKNSPDKYAQTIGLPSFDIHPILESVTYLLSGNIPYEFRTTVVKEFHTEQDFLEIGQWIQGAQHYFLQNFIDSSYVIHPGLHAYRPEDLQTFRNTLLPFVPNTAVRGIS